MIDETHTDPPSSACRFYVYAVPDLPVPLGMGVWASVGKRASVGERLWCGEGE